MFYQNLVLDVNTADLFRTPRSWTRCQFSPPRYWRTRETVWSFHDCRYCNHSHISRKHTVCSNFSYITECATESALTLWCLTTITALPASVLTTWVGSVRMAHKYHDSRPGWGCSSFTWWEVLATTGSGVRCVPRLPHGEWNCVVKATSTWKVSFKLLSFPLPLQV